ncbi:MAG: CARDB domain-containing protein [Methanobacteriota archaeon]
MRRTLALLCLAFLFGLPSPAAPQPGLLAPGDWVVTGTEVRTDEILVLQGNLTVRVGGSLVLRGVHLGVDSPSATAPRVVRVERGGLLRLEPSENAATVLQAVNTAAPFHTVVEGRFESVGTALRPTVIRDSDRRWPEGGITVRPGAEGFVLSHTELVDVGKTAVLVGSGNDIRIENVTFGNNGAIGLQLAGVTQGTVRDSTFHGMPEALVVTAPQRDLAIVGNSFVNNRDAVQLIATERVTLRENVITAPKRGVLLREGAAARLDGNVIDEHIQFGVVAFEGASFVWEGGRVRGAPHTGLVGFRAFDSGAIFIRNATVDRSSALAVQCVNATLAVEGAVLSDYGQAGIQARGCDVTLGRNGFAGGTEVLIEAPLVVAVTDEDGVGRAGIDVEILDGRGVSVFSGATGPTGATSEILLTTYRRISGTPTDMNPFTVRATPPGTSRLEEVVTLGRPRTLLLSPAALPDLSVGAPVLQPAAPAPGTRALLSFEVANRGRAPANATGLSVFVDGERLGAASLEVPALRPGETTRVEAVYDPVRAGSHVAVARVDPENALRESREDDNEARFYFRVAATTPVSPLPPPGPADGTTPQPGNASTGPEPKPDLSFVGPIVSSKNGTLRDGDGVTLFATYENAGEAPAGPFRVVATVNGLVVSDEEVAGLYPDERRTAVVGLVLPEGTHAVRIELDPGRVVAESDERGNFVETVLAAGPPAWRAAPPRGDDTAGVAFWGLVAATILSAGLHQTSRSRRK